MHRTTDRLTLSLTDFRAVCNVSDDHWKMVWTRAVFVISHSSDTLPITQRAVAQTLALSVVGSETGRQRNVSPFLILALTSSYHSWSFNLYYYPLFFLSELFFEWKRTGVMITIARG